MRLLNEHCSAKPALQPRKHSGYSNAAGQPSSGSAVKQMLTYFMRCRGLKRLEGELNTIRLQTNSQSSLQIDDWMLPQEFCLHTGSIPHRLLKEMLEHLPVGLKGEFLQAMINTQPNTQLMRDALLRGEPVNEAKLERRSHIRID